MSSEPDIAGEEKGSTPFQSHSDDIKMRYKKGQNKAGEWISLDP